MGTEKLKVRFNTVFTKTDMSRMVIMNDSKGKLLVTADVHGMSCKEAKRFLNNIINLTHTTFQLIVIHGYNRGTAIRDMIHETCLNFHITELYIDPHNQGRTLMSIA